MVENFGDFGTVTFFFFSPTAMFSITGFAFAGPLYVIFAVVAMVSALVDVFVFVVVVVVAAFVVPVDGRPLLASTPLLP